MVNKYPSKGGSDLKPVFMQESIKESIKEFILDPTDRVAIQFLLHHRSPTCMPVSSHPLPPPPCPVTKPVFVFTAPPERPKPAEPKPAEPKPAEPKPTEPKPSSSAVPLDLVVLTKPPVLGLAMAPHHRRKYVMRRRKPAAAPSADRKQDPDLLRLVPVISVKIPNVPPPVPPPAAAVINPLFLAEKKKKINVTLTTTSSSTGSTMDTSAICKAMGRYAAEEWQPILRQVEKYAVLRSNLYVCPFEEDANKERRYSDFIRTYELGAKQMNVFFLYDLMQTFEELCYKVIKQDRPMLVMRCSVSMWVVPAIMEYHADLFFMGLPVTAAQLDLRSRGCAMFHSINELCQMVRSGEICALAVSRVHTYPMLKLARYFVYTLNAFVESFFAYFESRDVLDRRFLYQRVNLLGQFGYDFFNGHKTTPEESASTGQGGEGGSEIEAGEQKEEQKEEAKKTEGKQEEGKQEVEKEAESADSEETEETEEGSEEAQTQPNSVIHLKRRKRPTHKFTKKKHHVVV